MSQYAFVYNLIEKWSHSPTESWASRQSTPTRRNPATSWYMKSSTEVGTDQAWDGRNAQDSISSTWKMSRRSSFELPTSKQGTPTKPTFACGERYSRRNPMMPLKMLESRWEITKTARRTAAASPRRLASWRLTPERWFWIDLHVLFLRLGMGGWGNIALTVKGFIRSAIELLKNEYGNVC